MYQILFCIMGETKGQPPSYIIWDDEWGFSDKQMYLFPTQEEAAQEMSHLDFDEIICHHSVWQVRQVVIPVAINP